MKCCLCGHEGEFDHISNAAIQMAILVKPVLTATMNTLAKKVPPCLTFLSEVVEYLVSLSPSSNVSSLCPFPVSPLLLLGPLKCGNTGIPLWAHHGCVRAVTPRQPSLLSSAPRRPLIAEDLVLPGVERSTDGGNVCKVCALSGGVLLQCVLCENRCHASCAYQAAAGVEEEEMGARCASRQDLLREASLYVCGECDMGTFRPAIYMSGNAVKETEKTGISSRIPQCGDTILIPSPQSAVSLLTVHPTKSSWVEALVVNRYFTHRGKLSVSSWSRLCVCIYSLHMCKGCVYAAGYAAVVGGCV